MTRRTLALYSGYQFFFSLLLWVPIFYDFQRRIGLSDPQIFGIQSVYYFAFCVLEIPTGWLADRFGHRRCLRASGVMLVAANLLPVYFPTYEGMLWHFLAIALARSLNSGASSAYLYEWLRENGKLELYRGAEGRARSYGLVGKVVFWAFIGAVMEWKLTLPYSLTAGAAAVSTVLAFALPGLKGEGEFRVPPRKAGGRALFGDIPAAFSALAGRPQLVFVMVQGVAIFVLARICQVNLFQPILAEKHFSVTAYGWMMSLTSIFEAIGSAYPGWRGGKKRVSDVNVVYLCTLAMAASLSGVALLGQWAAAAGLCAFSAAVGLSFPIQRQLLNDSIPDSRYRATLLSMESILDRAACAWVAAILGGFVAAGQIDRFLHLSAGASALLVVILLIRNRISL